MECGFRGNGQTCAKYARVRLIAVNNMVTEYGAGANGALGSYPFTREGGMSHQSANKNRQLRKLNLESGESIPDLRLCFIILSN